MDASRLRKLALFDGLPDEEISKIATFAEERSASAGQHVVREGDYSDRASIIEEGRAEVRHGSELVATLGPGDVFGEVGVLGRTMRNADVVATAPLRLVTLTRWDLKRVPETAKRIRELHERRTAPLEEG